jgi:2-oxoglutarate ferredoxin oxidoreductase subunit gamma
MARCEILLSGFGGQGLVLGGIILGEAVAVHDGRQATHKQSYGPEARGGASKSEVIVDDVEVSFPEIRHPDVFLAMTQEAVTKYGKNVKENGIAIVDPGLVFDEKALGGVKRVCRIPLTEIARGLGNEIVANIVALGALAVITGVVTREAILKSVLNHVPARTIELNKAALEAGFKAGEEALDIYFQK